MTQTIVYGTGNAAKFYSMKRALAPLALTIRGRKDLPVSVPDVDESGDSPLENARIKALSYFRAIRAQTGESLPVFSGDSGLYLEDAPTALQPGVHVRTIGGKYLSDDEMITHYAALAEKLGGRAVARYKNAVCLVLREDEIYEYMGDDISGEKFIIAAVAHAERVDGFPIDSLSIHMPSGKYYYDLPGYESDVGIVDQGFRDFFVRTVGARYREDSPPAGSAEPPRTV
jgi:8-oxo-dGTP diphosphatase